MRMCLALVVAAILIHFPVAVLAQVWFVQIPPASSCGSTMMDWLGPADISLAFSQDQLLQRWNTSPTGRPFLEPLAQERDSSLDAWEIPKDPMELRINH